MLRTFKIGDLFEGRTGDTDIKKEHLNEAGTFVVSSGVDNNGIIGKTDMPARIMPSHTLTVDMFGNCFYRDFEYKVVTHARVFTLVPKNFNLSVECGLYFVSILLWLKSAFSYNNMCSYKKIKNIAIQLPVTPSGDIDFKYMQERILKFEQERIAEFEQERIAELDSYLVASGLDDYDLTDEEKEILSLFPKSELDEAGALEADCGDGQIIFRTFKVGDVFSKVEAKCKKADFDKRCDTSTVPNEEYCVPLINAKVGDNGIMFYGRKSDWNTQEMCIDVIQNGAVATGTVYVQPQPVGVLWDAHLIKPVSEVKSVEILLYMAKCIEKITKEQFSYDKKATWDRVKLCEISLPITSDGGINFDYMVRYIHAIEKLAIADVVKYKDKLIATTKQVVGM